MKITALMTTVLVVFFMAGYIAYGQVTKSLKKAEVTQSDVKKETGEAIETTGAYVRQQKEQYQKEVEEKLQGIGGKIKELNRRAEKSGRKAKEKLTDAVEELKQKRDAVSDRLKGLREAGLEKWEKARTELDSMISDIERSYRRVSTGFEEQTDDKLKEESK